VIKYRQFTKGQKIFVIMGIFVCGLLFYANGVASNLISAPTYVGDIITFSALTVAVALTVITLTIVIRDKRRSLFAKKQKSIVANSDKESIEIPSSVLSSVDSQENTDKVESNIAAVQIVDESDKASVNFLPNSYRKKNLAAILIAIVAGLLLFVNAVSFKLIALPEYTMYFALAGAAALTIATIATVLIDKRKDALPKVPIVEVDGVIEESYAAPETLDTVSSPIIALTSADKVESDIVAVETVKVPDRKPVPVARLAKVFGKRNLFVIIVVLVVGLLLVANAGAFGLISLPQYSIYAALAGAIAIATIPLTILLGDKIKALGQRIKSFLAEPDIQEIIKEVKEPDQAPDIAPAPVIAQTSTIKVDPYSEMLRQFSVQRTARKLYADDVEQEKQLPKKPVILPTNVICPACRKEFSLPVYERDFIVDFGPLKKSNVIEPCFYCGALIPLKRKGDQEGIWKE
jgi:hypothetical protein